MRVVDDYVDEYLDRNMEYLMEEWDLATERDIARLSRRIRELEGSIDPARDVCAQVSRRLTELEARLKKLKEGSP
jgi:chromosome segregation ATPase